MFFQNFWSWKVDPMALHISCAPPGPLSVVQELVLGQIVAWDMWHREQEGQRQLHYICTHPQPSTSGTCGHRAGRGNMRLSWMNHAKKSKCKSLLCCSRTDECAVELKVWVLLCEQCNEVIQTLAFVDQCWNFQNILGNLNNYSQSTQERLFYALPARMNGKCSSFVCSGLHRSEPL